MLQNGGLGVSELLRRGNLPRHHTANPGTIACGARRGEAACFCFEPGRGLRLGAPPCPASKTRRPPISRPEMLPFAQSPHGRTQTRPAPPYDISKVHRFRRYYVLVSKASCPPGRRCWLRSDVGPKKLKPVLGPPCSKRGDLLAVPSVASANA